MPTRPAQPAGHRCSVRVIALLLNLRNFQTRLPQTVSALAGTGFIFGLVSLLILTRIDPGKPQPDLALMYLVLFGWSLAVDAIFTGRRCPSSWAWRAPGCIDFCSKFHVA